MTCSICGRRLRNPKSQELGYGPVCYRRIFGKSPKSSWRADGPPVPNESAEHYDIPGQISMEEYLQESRER